MDQRLRGRSYPLIKLPLVAVVGDDDDAGGRAGAMDDGLRAGGARRGEAAGEGAGHVEV